jgi:tetratricopeptide (TPR) repeat protein
VPLTLVWANFHAGVFFAPLTLALYGLGARLDGKRDARPLVVAALAAACTFATPAGTRLPSYLLWHTGLGATRIIDEFRRADPWNDPWFFALVTGCVLIALYRRREIGARRLLPLAVTALLAWRSVRFVAEWSLLAAPTIALGLEALGRSLAPALKRPDRFLRATAAVLIAAVAGDAWSARRGQPFAVGLAPDVVPFAAIDFVTRNGMRDRLYVDLDVGCYLLWEGWPRWSVFQDARLPAYPDSFHRALDETPLEPARFDALLAPFGVDAALLNTPDVNMRAGSFDPDEWALVLRSDEALVFARRVPKYTQVIAQHEIPLRLQFRFRGGTRAVALERPPARSPVAACEWQRRLAAALDGEGDTDGALDARARALDGGCLAGADEAETRYRLGARLQRAGRLREAAAQYDRALTLEPDDARILANRGFARLYSDPSAARADLTRALALDPKRTDVRHALDAN